MADLYLHGQKLGSIFELLGTKENDITYSIGWAMSQSPEFLRTLILRVLPDNTDKAVEEIRLQQHEEDGGYTDIEILGPNLHIIVEAKRGWWLPKKNQLVQYCSRFPPTKRQNQLLIVMSECSHKYATLQLTECIETYPVVYLNWKDVENLCRIQKGTHKEKHLLDELRKYLRRVLKMQNQGSNLVYVVALGAGRPEWSQLSWIDIVKKRHYFHPVGTGGWPKDPPNYIGFRYDGKLQHIHHVDSWKITKDIHQEMPELNPGRWEPHFFYTLGEPIFPQRTVATGKIYPNGRVWAMIDLLLTCNKISEARDLTKERQAEEG